MTGNSIGSRRRRTGAAVVFRFTATAIVVLLAPGDASSAEPTWQELQNLPSWAAPILNDKSFASTYALSTRMNPFFLQGDFNGDGRLDLAVLIERRQTAQQGIAILHAGASNAMVLGAGRSLGNGGDDFNWLDAWSVYARNLISPGTSRKQSPALRGDALLVQKLEAASALIYWDGAAYRWRQQGD